MVHNKLKIYSISTLELKEKYVYIMKPSDDMILFVNVHHDLVTF